jgi:integrase
MSYHRAAPGIYRDSRTGNFYERPVVAGRPTWRKLDGHTLKLARESFAQRRADATRSRLGLAADPYRPKTPTCGALIEAYVAAGCPGRNFEPRTGPQLTKEQSRLKALKAFWAARNPTEIRAAPDCAEYFATRRKTVRRGHGGRAVDLETTTLAAVFDWAIANRHIDANPLKQRPRFRQKTVRHCRDVAPLTAEEVHALPRHFFEVRRSQTLGWQVLLEFMTGCRTSEILQLRWDAKKPSEPGFIEGEWLWLNRTKGGVNPFAHIHPALRTCLDALRLWQDSLPPQWRSAWFLPSLHTQGQPLHVGALTHALRTAGPLITERPITSHGFRSFYVTVRRSQGIADAQIAAEIGDKSGAAIITQTYGAIPPNWRGGGKALTWMPDKAEPAWKFFEERKRDCMPNCMQPAQTNEQLQT